MADKIELDVQGVNFHTSLEAMPGAVRNALITTITSLVTIMAAKIIAKAPRKTGKLASKILSRVFTDNPNRIAGYVSVRGDKGKSVALDKGSNKTITVKGHEAHLDHAWGRQLNSPTTVFVEAFTRHLNITPTLFVTDPAQGMQSEIEAAIAAAIDGAVQQVQQ